MPNPLLLIYSRHIVKTCIENHNDPYDNKRRLRNDKRIYEKFNLIYLQVVTYLKII